MLLPITDEALAQATALLRGDQVVAFPTETVYGLGANALSEVAVERIYRLKGRPRHNPLIVHVPDQRAAMQLSSAWPAVATRLAERFWPGPLTLVVPRGSAIPALVSAGRPTVALRVPAHPAALRLLRACGLPLAAPSANRSEQVSPTTAEHVRRGLPDVPLILDGGPCRLGIESTVVDVTTSPPRLLRPGALGLQALREVLPDLATLPAAWAEDGEALASPGMMARHYAPRARLILLQPSQLGQLGALPAPWGLLSYGEGPPQSQLGLDGTVLERLPADPEGYAADFYAALHRLDDAGVATIGVVEPPAGDEDGWHAIRDRLRRAAAPPPQGSEPP